MVQPFHRDDAERRQPGAEKAPDDHEPAPHECAREVPLPSEPLGDRRAGRMLESAEPAVFVIGVRRSGAERLRSQGGRREALTPLVTRAVDERTARSTTLGSKAVADTPRRCGSCSTYARAHGHELDGIRRKASFVNEVVRAARRSVRGDDRTAGGSCQVIARARRLGLCRRPSAARKRRPSSPYSVAEPTRELRLVPGGDEGSKHETCSMSAIR